VALKCRGFPTRAARNRDQNQAIREWAGKIGGEQVGEDIWDDADEVFDAGTVVTARPGIR
jgi:hypothetical protein